MLVAFEGWNDAGEAATGTIDHCVNLWNAELVTTLDDHGYFDLQAVRPIVRRVGGTPQIMWPATNIFRGVLPDGRPVFLVQSIEPSMRWKSFVNELLDLAEGFDVETVIVLGALLADVPHTRALPTFASSSSETTRSLRNLSASEYEGPTGIAGVFEATAALTNLESISVWVSVPHYTSDMTCAPAVRALSQDIESLLEVPTGLEDLTTQARAWIAEVTALVAENPELETYVESLEAAHDTASLPEASGEAIAAAFERYLRRNEP